MFLFPDEIKESLWTTGYSPCINLNQVKTIDFTVDDSSETTDVTFRMMDGSIIRWKACKMSPSEIRNVLQKKGLL